jgi:hypothetical protein
MKLRINKAQENLLKDYDNGVYSIHIHEGCITPSIACADACPALVFIFWELSDQIKSACERNPSTYGIVNPNPSIDELDICFTALEQIQKAISKHSS